MKSEKQIAEFQAQLAARLKAEREKKGISKTELSNRTGISRQGIRLIEEGERSPSVTTLWQLASGLGFALEKMFSKTQ